ncbi:MAG: glycosyltransferase family 4 protein [Lachnospiraceae bacterium]|jgi:glycosyltransferase involved in cell wall biosynthesis|nr:glycosyltransferase family 4 protein [Lachnospiraceae bacterium]
MKIIVANYRFFIAGGPERYMFNFMTAAQNRGIEIIPFSVQNARNVETKYCTYFAKPRADALMYSDTKRSLANLCGMFRAVVWNRDASTRLRRLIRDTKPDAVYILHEVNHLSPSIIRAAKKEGVRVVHRISDFFMFCARYDFLYENNICEACIHGNYEMAVRRRCVKGSRAATWLRILAMKLYQWNGVFKDVDIFVTPTAFTRRKLIEGGVPASKIVHIPTFVDCERVTPCYTQDKYFLFLGRVAEQKGTIYAIQAMNHLRDSEYILKITGVLSDTKEDLELKRYIETHHLENKIVFTGFLKGDALEHLISQAVCVVCPAIWYENMPNAVLEAYAHGKAVVASRIGSMDEIVEEGETGFLFTPKDSYELAEQLKRFIDDKNLSRYLGENARKKCETEYGEAIHMERVLTCLFY